MTKSELNKFMKQVDKIKRPKHWQKFINKQTESHNLILKCGKRAFCTHCQKYFDKDISINNYEKELCPYCNNEYYVRNNNVKKFSFYKDVAFFSKIDGKIILRIFEIESLYDFNTKKFKHTLQEYARFVPTVRNNYK